MAQKHNVSIPVHYFSVGVFPPLCSKTGVPTSNKLSLSAERNNPVAAIGLLLGIIGLIVMLHLTKTTVEGAVPFEGDPEGLKKRRKLGVTICVVSMVCTVLLAPVSAGLALIAVLGLLVGIGYLVVSPKGVKASLSKDGHLVTLNDVHPTFAEATRQMLVTHSHAAAPPPPPSQPQFDTPTPSFAPASAYSTLSAPPIVGGPNPPTRPARPGVAASPISPPRHPAVTADYSQDALIT